MIKRDIILNIKVDTTELENAREILRDINELQELNIEQKILNNREKIISKIMKEIVEELRRKII